MNRSRRFPFLAIETSAAVRGELVALLAEMGTLGLEELEAEGGRSAVLKAYFEDERALQGCLVLLRADFPAARVLETGQVDLADWESALHGDFEPIAVGPLLVLPDQPRPPAIPADSIPLVINPGLGFGSGSHPTTALCLELLCELVRPGDRVLDVGAGSGILAIGAALMGAADVLAVDIDPDAIDNAAENLRLNGVGDRVRLRRGSLERAAEGGGGPYDLVLANILAPVLAEMLGSSLADLVAPGGAAVLSGFSPADSPRIERLAARAGLAKADLRTGGKWAALLLRKIP